MFKPTIITQQEMPKITLIIKKRKCFLIVELEIADLLFGILWTKKDCKTIKHFRNQLKSVLLSEYKWFYFGACLVCSFVFCLIVYKVFFFLFFFCFVFVLFCFKSLYICCNLSCLKFVWPFDRVLNIMFCFYAFASLSLRPMAGWG